MKFLCICEGGTVRSVGLAYHLKSSCKQDAIAASWRWNTRETLQSLGEWADFIVLLQDVFLERAEVKEAFDHERFHPKLRMLNVGPDVFGSALNPALFAALTPVLQDWAQRGFKI